MSSFKSLELYASSLKLLWNTPEQVQEKIKQNKQKINFTCLSMDMLFAIIGLKTSTGIIQIELHSLQLVTFVDVAYTILS